MLLKLKYLILLTILFNLASLLPKTEAFKVTVSYSPLPLTLRS